MEGAADSHGVRALCILSSTGKHDHMLADAIQLSLSASIAACLSDGT